MLEVSLIDRDLYLQVRRRQAQLWDALLGRVADILAGVADGDWGSAPRVSHEEIHQDLEFGRE